ncbi:MAG: Serralysin [Devosia sp.]|nr:Serralysin [Devosia sp.]
MAPTVYNLNQIVGALTTNWGGDQQGQTITWKTGPTITYSIGIQPNSPRATNVENAGFRAMDSTEASYARQAFDYWDDLIARDLTESSSADANIGIAMSSTTKNGGTYASQNLVAQPPGSSTFDRDFAKVNIWLNTGWTDFQPGAGWEFGQRGLETMIHEIGHSLGLSHPGTYDASDAVPPTYADDALYTLDTLQYTVMSYWAPGSDGIAIDRTGGGNTGDANGDGINAATPMLHDIMAIQALYGADLTTRTGNDTYGFNISMSTGGYRRSFDFANPYNPDPVVAIYDAGGIDRLDVSGYTQNQIVDLRPGTFSSIGALTFNVAIAYNTIIEDAAGGSGNDHLYGNHVANALWGNAGYDILEGFDGNDWLDAGWDASGSQSYGGNQDDYIFATGGADYVDGGNGTDTLDFSRASGGVSFDPTYGKKLGAWVEGDTIIGIENIIGSAYADEFGLGDTGNSIRGGGGNDRLAGYGGNDALYGEADDDTLFGGTGADYLDGGAGFNIASFSDPVTINLQSFSHTGEAAGDTFVNIQQFNTGAGADTVTGYLNSANRIATGDGDDTLYGGNSGDWLQGGKGADYINGGDGSDTVSYLDSTTAITVQMEFTDGNGSSGKVLAGEWGYDTLISIENVEGTNYNDRMEGDEGSNTFWGMGGDDRMQGDSDAGPQGSVDVMYGGAGNDSVLIGANDYAFGGANSDTATFVGDAIYINYITNQFFISGATFQLYEFETYIGSALADTMVGGNWAESFIVGAGADAIYGQGGNDFLYTSDGADIMDGGADFDTIVFDRAMVADWQNGILDAAIASDSFYNWEAMQGSAGNDIIRTNSWGYAITLKGGAGNDILATGPDQSVDTLKGEDGNDKIDGGGGNDDMDGGKGNDIIYVRSAGDIVREKAGEGSDTVISSVSFALAAGVAVERLTLSSSAGASSLTGNELDQVLTGNASSNGLTGGLGNDTVNYADAAAGVTVDLRYNSAQNTIGAGIDTIRSVENIIGSDYADRLFGDEDANILRGGGGNDRLEGFSGRDIFFGGKGADVLLGGLGNDTYNIDDAKNIAVETSAAGSGIDRVNSSVNYTLQANVEELVMAGTGDLDATGNDSENMIFGNAGDNKIDGLDGADRLYGGDGVDTLLGGLDRDRLDGGSGNDKLNGQAGNDLMIGGLGDDSYYVDSVGDVVYELAGAGSGIDIVRAVADHVLSANVENLILTGVSAIDGAGNEMANKIYGNAANNVIYGKLGNDFLYGGAGADSFVFNTTISAANVDTIDDFDRSNDIINLQNTGAGLFNALAAGVLKAAAFNVGTAATQDDDHIIYDKNSGVLLYDADGLGGAAGIRFAILDNKPPVLSAADFFVI